MRTLFDPVSDCHVDVYPAISAYIINTVHSITISSDGHTPTVESVTPITLGRFFARCPQHRLHSRAISLIVMAAAPPTKDSIIAAIFGGLSQELRSSLGTYCAARQLGSPNDWPAARVSPQLLEAALASRGGAIDERGSNVTLAWKNLLPVIVASRDPAPLPRPAVSGAPGGRPHLPPSSA